MRALGAARWAGRKGQPSASVWWRSCFRSPHLVRPCVLVSLVPLACSSSWGLAASQGLRGRDEIRRKWNALRDLSASLGGLPLTVCPWPGKCPAGVAARL